MTTNYRRGADFERRVRDYVMKYYDVAYVVRAAGSHTVADLVALQPAAATSVEDISKGIYHPRVWLIQCKLHGRISAEDRELLIDVANECGATAVLARAGKNGRGVELEFITKPEETVGDEGVAD